MTQFNYSGGDPGDLVPGGAIDFTDLRESFADFKTYINGANLDGQNLASSFFSPYWTIQSESQVFYDNNVTGAGTYYACEATSAGSFMILSGGTSTRVPVLVPINTNDYTITGRSPRLRLSVITATDTTAPGINFVYGLHPISSTGGPSINFTTTVGTAVTGSTITRNAPAANSLFRDTSGDFALPSSGVYLFGCVVSGTIAANALVGAMFNLQVHWV